MTPQTVIGLHSVWVRDMSGTRRFWFGNVSADSTQFGIMSDLIRSWIGFESVSGRPTYARYITDLQPTNHLPSVAELRPTRPRTLPDKTDTTPTYNRQTTDNLSGRDLSNMFERFIPDKFVCPNINRHQTDKTVSIPTVNRSLPEFDDFCRFEVGFVSVWSVWLGYNGRFSFGVVSIIYRSQIGRFHTESYPKWPRHEPDWFYGVFSNIVGGRQLHGRFIENFAFLSVSCRFGRCDWSITLKVESFHRIAALSSLVTPVFSARFQLLFNPLRPSDAYMRR